MTSEHLVSSLKKRINQAWYCCQMNNTTGPSDHMLCPSPSCARAARALMAQPRKGPSFPDFQPGGLFRKQTWIARVVWITRAFCLLLNTAPSNSTVHRSVWPWLQFSLSLYVWLTNPVSRTLGDVGFYMVFWGRGGLVRRSQGLEWSVWYSWSIKSVRVMPPVYMSCIKRDLILEVLREDVFVLLP